MSTERRSSLPLTRAFPFFIVFVSTTSNQTPHPNCINLLHLGRRRRSFNRRKNLFWKKLKEQKQKLTLISSGLPIVLPPTLRPLAIRVKALMSGRSLSRVLDESAAGSEEGKVAAQGHIGRGDSADNQVENAHVRQGPIRVIPTGGYEFVCAQLQSVFSLTVGATYGNDFYCA